MVKIKPTHIRKVFNVGDIIARQDTAAACVFIVMKGKIGLFDNYGGMQDTPVITLGANDIFGENEFFTEAQYNFTAVALEESSLVVLDMPNMYKLFVMDPEGSASIYNKLINEITEISCEKIKPEPASGLFTAPGAQAEPETAKNTYFPEVEHSLDVKINKADSDYFVHFKAQKIIFENKHRVNRLYVLLNGHAGMFNGRKKIADIRPGNFIGGINFIGNVATELFVAIKNSDMFVLTPDNIESFFRNEPKSAFMVLKLLCERINLLHKSDEPEKALPKSITIIPHDHKSYDIELKTDRALLQEKYFFCPVCNKGTQSLISADSLDVKSSDDDSRLHYDGIDPIYYDIISCNNCWYTSLREYFDRGRATLQYFQQTMRPVQSSVNFKMNKSSYNINDVIFAYYFSLFCSNECFNSGRSLIHAKHWLRLSWIYHDCNDTDMEKYASKKAKDLFVQAFSESALDDGRQAYPLRIVTGVLCNKVGDTKNAKFFLSEVALKAGAEKMKDRARELMKKYRL